MYAMQGAEGGGGSQLNNDPDISGLNSLCMSVCEHALSGNGKYLLFSAQGSN